jgi:PAS domain S-box-containing protein/putative nucleotidyltransferase with HDIG domain
MGQPLRVLLVEDSEEDAELILRQLRRGGYKLISLRVETREDLEAALTREQWEVLIVDHNLPHFDSLKALQLTKQLGLDTPFIIVSGSIGEETAVNAMRAGAQDYVLKNNLVRLLPAIQRELQEAKERKGRRQAEAALHRQEALFRSLIENALDGICILDKDGKIRFASPAMAQILGRDSMRIEQENVLKFVHPEDLPLLTGLLSARDASPAASIHEIRCRHKDDTWHTLEIALSDARNNPVVNGIIINVRDISGRKLAEANLRESIERQRATLEATLEALTLALEKRDPYTAGHERRVTGLACALAREVGMNEEQITTIRAAGILHDIGKIYVPAEILSKPGKLTALEVALIRNHPQVGYEILKSVPFPGPVAEVVLQHQERLDGSGYPAGLAGGNIMPEAKVLSVADVVEAMTSHRPYRPALGLAKALEEILRNRGVLYEEKVVDACVELLSREAHFLA